MLTIERTPIAMGDTVGSSELQEHMRLDADLVDGAVAYVKAASAEVEAYCNIALLDQTVTALSDTFPDTSLALPVGPVAADATITVELQETDGTYTAVTDGWFLQAGLFPKLHFASTPGGRMRVTYPAGYGDTSTDIPADLRLAICDLSARLYDYRASDKTATMPAATARICARYRKVKVGA